MKGFKIMKKYISIIFSIALVFVMLATLSGCGDKSKFIGSWEADVDLSDIINEQIKNEPQMAEYIKFNDITIKFKFEFKEDDTCTLSVDKDDFNKTYDKIVNTFTEGVKKYLEAAAEQYGNGMTADDILNASGMDMNALINQAINKDDILNSFEEAEVNGKFKVEDGKLYTSNDVNSDSDMDNYLTYEIINDSEIKLIDSSDDDNEAFKQMLPMTLKKK